MNLRPYQVDAENRIREAFANRIKRVCYQLSTGGGKTVIFASVARKASIKGKRILILVHRRELLRQTSRSLLNLGVRHGLVRAGMSTDQNQSVLVASVQTLVRRLNVMQWRPDLIIVDECHHAIGVNTWGQVLAHYSSAYVLGVTATPARTDGRGLTDHFDTLICGPSMADLTRMGYLSPAKCFTAPLGETVSVEGVTRRAGDFAKDQLAEAANKPRLVGCAISHYRQHCHQQPAIAFCASIEHAERMAEAFRNAGYQAASVDGSLEQRERDRRIADLGDGGLHVLTSCDLISEGVDVPVVSAAIMLRPTQSLVLHLQQIGRALRVHDSKTHATILDHAGNIHRHGLPDDERAWTLEGVPKKERAANAEDSDYAVVQCPECYHVHRPRPDRKCPECGYQHPVKARRIDYADGELREVSGRTQVAVSPEQQVKKARNWARLKQIAEQMGAPLADVIRMNPNQAAQCATTREELMQVADAMRYKPGWVEWRLSAKESVRSRYRRVGNGRYA